MVLDAVANFVRGTTDAAVDNSQTTISVGNADIFPDPAVQGEYNVVIWDAESSPRPDQDPNVEILRVTAIDTGADDLTVTRAQETTAAATHPSGSAVHLSPTAKMFSDIESEYTAQGEDFDGEGASEFSNLQSVSTDDTTAKRVNDIRNAQQYTSIQPALDDQTYSGHSGIVLVPDPLDDSYAGENLTMDGDGTTLTGYGVGSVIVDDGGHTLTVTARDCDVEDLYIDNNTSGQDALRLDNAINPVVRRCDLHAENGRYGLYTNSRNTWVQETFVAGRDTAAYIDGGASFSYFHIQGQYEGSLAGDAIYHAASNCRIEYIIDQAVGRGVEITGSQNHGPVIVQNCGEEGLVVTGDANVLTVQLYNNSQDITDTPIKIGGEGNIILGKFVDDIEFVTGSSHNRIFGPVYGNISDNGTGNLINGLAADSANAESPTSSDYMVGDLVDFTDTGDGSGSGIYVKDRSGSMIQLS